MKYRILMIGGGIVLLLTLTAAVDAGRVKRDAKTPLASEQTGNPEAIAIPQPESPSPLTEQEPNVQPPQPTPNATANPNAYEINWQSINGGGEDMQSATYEIQSSIGQATIGEASSNNYEVGVGYWYGVSSDNGDCNCDCHAAPDPMCASAVDVLDVVWSVNVAFRNYPNVVDPNPLCSKATTDVDCDDDTDILDVVKFVNVAFRNYNAGATFCDPCP